MSSPDQERQILDNLIKSQPEGVPVKQLLHFANAQKMIVDPVKYIEARTAIGAIQLITAKDPETGKSRDLVRSSAIPLKPGETQNFLSRYDLD